MATHIQKIIDEVRSYDQNADVDLIQNAFELSSKVHSGQKRASGEPYLTHPLDVAAILAKMKLDSASVASGLLHDTVEDTLLTLEEIKKQFGEEISNLVDGVTKLSRIKFSSKEEKQAENFRKMILAMAADIRVVLIKLADRLHNMRTLSHLSVERQRKIATETLEIFAPLANRLGIQWMKVELENLCLKYLKPDMYQFLYDSIEKEKKKLVSYMEDVKAKVDAELKKNSIPHEISGRLKHVYSVYRKMEAQELAFDQVHDLIAFRVIVHDIRQCYEVLGVLHELWKPVPGRFKDYLAMPKVNKYQSLHTTVICFEGQRVEFQIRTKVMHEVAEGGIAAHWNYKEDGSITEQDRGKFQWLRELIELQKDTRDPSEFLDAVKLDLFATDVYVFSPKGELIEMSYGSTPVDFAYSIHTDVGNQCVGAKVDDRIVPLDYKLQSGDTVVILTKKGSRPNRDWLKFVQSSKARNKIRHEIKQEQRGQAIQLGKDLLTREIEKYHVKPSKYLKGDALGAVAKEEFHLKNAESLFAQLGYGKITANHVVEKVLPPETYHQEATPPKKMGILGEIFKKVKRKTKTGIRVGGHQDILVTLGKCCSPLPGDSITGFITRGRGVMIHAVDCPRVMANDPERRVDVNWDLSPDVSHQAKIKIITIDKPGILASLSKKISNMGLNISQANIRTTNDEKAVNIFTMEIKSRSELDQVMAGLEAVKGVITVTKIRS